MVGPNRWLTDIIAAAEARGWHVIRADLRAGVTLEEPISHGLTLNIHGSSLTPEFIESLPEACQPAPPIEVGR